MGTIRVAAIQMCAELGAVDHNLSRAESLVREAFGRGAEWVVLPEFFPSAVAFAPVMLNAWQPLDGRPFELMRKLAQEYGGIVGGSFIAKHDADCLNSFLLVFPDGRCLRHDKDIPTLWENAYYIGGSDDGVLETPFGPVGIALCWEQIRSQTARRLFGKVALVLGGSCWWDLAMPVPAKYAQDQLRNIELLAQAPGHLARMLGVPVVHASHAGKFSGRMLGKEMVPYESRYLGQAQIVDGHGEMLARMTPEDGEGVIVADVKFGAVPGERTPIPVGFWTAEPPPIALKAWELGNPLAQEYYVATTRPLLQRASLS